MYRAKYLVKRDSYETTSRKKKKEPQSEGHEITLVIDHPQPEPTRAAHSSDDHIDSDPANTPQGAKQVRFKRQIRATAPSRPGATSRGGVGGGTGGGGAVPSKQQRATAPYQQQPQDSRLATGVDRTCAIDSEAMSRTRFRSHWLSAARAMRPSTAQNRRHTACNRVLVSLAVATVCVSVFGLHPFETVHLSSDHGDMGSHPGWGTLGIDFQKGLQGPGGKSLHVLPVHPSLAFQDIKKTEGLGVGRHGPGDEVAFERHEKTLVEEEERSMHRADVGQSSAMKEGGGREIRPG